MNRHILSFFFITSAYLPLASSDVGQWIVSVVAEVNSQPIRVTGCVLGLGLSGTNEVYVVTSSKAVENANRIRVYFPERYRFFEAEVLKDVDDPIPGLALLRVDQVKGINLSPIILENQPPRQNMVFRSFSYDYLTRDLEECNLNIIDIRDQEIVLYGNMNSYCAGGPIFKDGKVFGIISEVTDLTSEYPGLIALARTSSDLFNLTDTMENILFEKKTIDITVAGLYHPPEMLDKSGIYVPSSQKWTERCRGQVTFQVVVDSRGEVTDVEKIKSGVNILDLCIQEVARELKKRRFRPGTIDGRPIVTTKQVVVTFE